jgi:hypothetical protein
MKNINSLVETWMKKNIKNPSPFFKKLLILWPKIVGTQLSKFSIPNNFLTENNQNLLIVYVYNGPASIRMQSIVPQIKNRILIQIGYQPIKDIRIIQKMNFLS